MTYTYSITSKGQITIPKEFRDKLGLNLTRQATIQMKNDQIILSAPKTIKEVRELLKKPTFADPVSENEKLIGDSLAAKYGVS